MKKIIFLAFMALGFFSVSAQMWVGGSIGFTSTSSDSENQGYTSKSDLTRFDFTPEVGYALNDRFSLALALGYNLSHIDGSTIAPDGTKVGHDNKLHGFTIHPYVRYHFAEWQKVRFFVDGGLKYTDTSNKLNDVRTSTTSFAVTFAPGISYQLTPRLGLVTHIGSLGWERTDADSGVDNDFFLSLTNNLYFGFYVNL